MAALVVLRDKVIKPLLAGSGRVERGPDPAHRNDLDTRYEAVQREMKEVFRVLQLAA